MSPRAGGVASPSRRRTRAAESFRTAADCIGPVGPDTALFGFTRGQFSMLDIVAHLLAEVGPARVSLWTWTIAEYEVDVFLSFLRSGKITDGLLVIDGGARNNKAALIGAWRSAFGSSSVRYVVNHAKIATVEAGDLRLLARGSMNLNFNPRFEQFDLTANGLDFDLVREVEAELPVLPDDASGQAIYAASRVGEAFEPERLALFQGLKPWRPK